MRMAKGADEWDRAEVILRRAKRHDQAIAVFYAGTDATGRVYRTIAANSRAAFKTMSERYQLVGVYDCRVTVGQLALDMQYVAGIPTTIPLTSPRPAAPPPRLPAPKPPPPARVAPAPRAEPKKRPRADRLSELWGED